MNDVRLIKKKKRCPKAKEKGKDNKIILFLIEKANTSFKIIRFVKPFVLANLSHLAEKSDRAEPRLPHHSSTPSCGSSGVVSSQSILPLAPALPAPQSQVLGRLSLAVITPEPTLGGLARWLPSLVGCK